MIGNKQDPKAIHCQKKLKGELVSFGQFAKTGYQHIVEGLQDPELGKRLLQLIHCELESRFCFMEVCGTHTVAIFQSGLHSLLPAEIKHLSGPGCPVCVTHEQEVAAFLNLAAQEDVIIATFGDLMRVPGPQGKSLKSVKAGGARVEVVYSPFDALTLARQNLDKKVVFLGVGFETTAPTVAAAIKVAAKEDIHNFYVLTMHKLVPPALKALLEDTENCIDAFLLPGHVSSIIGVEPYAFVAEDYGLSCCITGFEPLDILQSLLILLRQRKKSVPAVINQYSRAVKDKGNLKAAGIMQEVFEVSDAKWRGLGSLPGSGLVLRSKYAQFDAQKAFELKTESVQETPGCKCGEILKGKLTPDQCPLFARKCTPAHPVGPCMVSTEGSCAAYYKYGFDLKPLKT